MGADVALAEFEQLLAVAARGDGLLEVVVGDFLNAKGYNGFTGSTFGLFV